MIGTCFLRLRDQGKSLIRDNHPLKVTMEDLYINLVILSKKSREEIGSKRFMTFDLHLGQVKGQRKFFYQIILAISSWDFTIRTFICPFFSTFAVIIPWQHDMSGHRSGYQLLGPWPMCPASFIEIFWKLGHNLSHGSLQHGRTRGTVPRGTVNPIPQFQMSIVNCKEKRFFFLGI